MNTDYAKEVMDGALLSDANIYPSRGSCEVSRYQDSYFRMQLGGCDHTDWLYSLKNQLEVLGIDFSSAYPKLAKRKSDGYVSSWLISHVSPFLSGQRRRWYPDGTKIVPTDLVLTPVSVANWFMGDGTSSYNGNVSVMTTFGTYGFPMIDVLRLRHMMHELDILTGLANYEKGSVITIMQNSVDKMMALVEPYLVSSFKYKVKYRRGH